LDNPLLKKEKIEVREIYRGLFIENIVYRSEYNEDFPHTFTRSR